MMKSNQSFHRYVHLQKCYDEWPCKIQNAIFMRGCRTKSSHHVIYINDILTVTDSQVRLFADDTSLVLLLMSPNSAASAFNNALLYNISD